VETKIDSIKKMGPRKMHGIFSTRLFKQTNGIYFLNHTNTRLSSSPNQISKYTVAKVGMFINNNFLW